MLDLYQQLSIQAESLIEGEDDLIANLANVSALVFQSLDRINWAGFYLLKHDELVLGPFQGKPACLRIAIGKGVCGTAVKTRVPQVVEDVLQFPEHIACDPDSRSEIVIPIFYHGVVMGVLDIDSQETGRFTKEDLLGLQKLVDILQQHLA